MENTVALNHCRWHESGHQIAAGDDLGRIYVYDVGEVSTTKPTSVREIKFYKS